jgi:hypothetical protein
MSPESVIEKPKAKETMPLAEMKKVILEFVNEKYPENSILEGNKEARRNGLEACQFVGTAEEDVISLCQMKKTLELMGAYTKFLNFKKDPELLAKATRFEKVHKILNNIIEEKLKN